MSTSSEPNDMLPTQLALDTPQPDEHAPQQPMETSTRPSIAGGMFQPLRVRNFNLLFGGQTISTVGDALYAVALPWLILNNGGSAQELGIVLTAYAIPRVGSVLLGGWLSDRLRPRRVMLLADIMRFVCTGLLAILTLRSGPPNLLALCAVVIPLGAFGGLFLPASAAILPDILDGTDLQAGNALNFSSTQTAGLVGSAIAGIVVATLAAGVALAGDALSFAVSAISLAMMRLPNVTRTQQLQELTKAADAPTTDDEQSEPQEAPLTFGHYLRTSRLIQVAFLVSIIANFCAGGLMEVALPTLVHGPMHGGAGGYGAILAAFGAGALAGGVIAGMLGKTPRKGLLAMLICLLQGLTIALLPYGGVIGAVVLMIISGLSNSISNVLLLTLVQLSIPRHLMGRVMGLLMFASFGTAPISLALVGVLATYFGPAILFPFSGVAFILAILFGIAQKELRTL